VKVQQSSVLGRGPLTTLTLYAAMVIATLGAFHWLTSLGSRLTAPAATLKMVGQTAVNAGGVDLFLVLLALLLVLVTSRIAPAASEPPAPTAQREPLLAP
jgi:hypothetical protein